MGWLNSWKLWRKDRLTKGMHPNAEAAMTHMLDVLMLR